MKRILLTCLLSLAVTAGLLHGQANFPATGYTQNFDSMGTSGTTPPSGWKHLSFNMTTSNGTWTNGTGIPANGTNSVASIAVSTASTTLVTATTPTANQNNGYNAAASAGATSDRVIATAPTNVTGSGIELAMTNGTGSTLTGLTVAFDTVRYSAVTTANELPGYWLFVSANGTTWTNVTPNPTLTTVPNTAGTTSSTLSISGLSVASAGTFYLRWLDDNAAQGSPDQIIGLNNVAISLPAPTVTGISPANGTTLGGTPVTITGTNFTGATGVTIGGTAATGVSVTNDTTITATTPAHTAGAASVVVTTPSGANAANTLFTYVVPNVAPSFTLPSGPPPVVSTLAGSTASNTGYVDATGTAARFNSPYGVAVDSTGNVYVADTFNHAIRKITPGGVVTTLAGSTAGDDGYVDATGTGARFQYPAGVAVDSTGNVYVADANNNAIRKITPGGVVTTLAGSTAGTSGYVDATGTDARFNYPEGVAVDSTGNVYVADNYNSAIRKITSGGEVTTLAGSTAGDDGYVDATGTAARFNYPTGVAMDSSGNVYVLPTAATMRSARSRPAVW